MPVQCFAIGQHADLLDVHGHGPTSLKSARSARSSCDPDGHVAWRARSLPDAPSEQLNAVLDQLSFYSRPNPTRESGEPVNVVS